MHSQLDKATSTRWADVHYETDAGTLTIQPAYREASLDYQFNGVFRGAASVEKDKQTSVEARWAGYVAQVTQMAFVGEVPAEYAGRWLAFGEAARAYVTPATRPGK